MSQTLEQQRAKHAFKAVRDVVDNHAEDSGKYKSYAKKVPMMIKTNGLGATLAFMKGKSKKETAYHLLLETTTAWLKKADTTFDLFTPSSSLRQAQGANRQAQGTADADLLDTLVKQNSDDYRRVTLEVMALYGWLRRFVEAEIDKEDNGDDRNA